MTERKKLTGVYRAKIRDVDGISVWLVDGGTVRREFWNDFIQGGNGARYKFVPIDEIWVDNSVTPEEVEYTIKHELIERDLMIHEGLNYDDAHDKAVRSEVKMRMADKEASDRKEKETDPVPLGAYFHYGKD